MVGLGTRSAIERAESGNSQPKTARASALPDTMAGRLRPTTVSTTLQKIATLAREAPQRVLTTLAHHLALDFLREAYRRTRKDGAPGVDGQTAAAYAEALESNLQGLLDRLKAGTYVAPPVRRAYVPKEERGESRPIGIPTFEDKVLQRAVAMILEAVYEQDFLDCSYGFRPGRAAHQALPALWGQLMRVHGGWVIKVDIRKYFDTLSHSHLREFLDQRVRDGVMRRTIDKWLKAGVLEAGCVKRSDTGVPQGSGVAPILSNVFLHDVFDHWFVHEVQPRVRGEAICYRFADDIAVGCATEDDAHRIMAVLPKRFGKYGVTLHPEKTRVLGFRCPPPRSSGEESPQPAEPASFDLLGFTHYWGRSRRGQWVIKRKTAKGRLSRALKRINTWCRRFRHAPVAWQSQQLAQQLRGHYAYDGITGNDPGLKHFLYGVRQRWQKWLNRRSQRRSMPWSRFYSLLQHYPLPRTRIVHAASTT